MKLRTHQPWISAEEYGHSLRGLTINLIARNMKRLQEFQNQVLGAKTIYCDPDFVVFQGYGSEWMVHADHTYADHPLQTVIQLEVPRGGIAELRLHGCDPDRAETQARLLDFLIVQPATDKPHGLRECYLRDDEGYLWVPDQPLVESQSLTLP